MNMEKYQQFEIRKKATFSFMAMLAACTSQFILIYFNVDRITSSYVTFFVFWPLYLYAFYLSIVVVKHYVKHFKSINIIYLLLTIPVFAFLIYFLVKVIS